MKQHRTSSGESHKDHSRPGIWIPFRAYSEKGQTSSVGSSNCRIHEAFSPGDAGFGQNLVQTYSKVTQRQNLPPQAGAARGGFYKSSKSIPPPSLFKFFVCFYWADSHSLNSFATHGADIPERAAEGSRTRNSILKCIPWVYFWQMGFSRYRAELPP